MLFRSTHTHTLQVLSDTALSKQYYEECAQMAVRILEVCLPTLLYCGHTSTAARYTYYGYTYCYCGDTYRGCTHSMRTHACYGCTYVAALTMAALTMAALTMAAAPCQGPLPSPCT